MDYIPGNEDDCWVDTIHLSFPAGTFSHHIPEETMGNDHSLDDRSLTSHGTPTSEVAAELGQVVGCRARHPSREGWPAARGRAPWLRRGTLVLMACAFGLFVSPWVGAQGHLSGSVNGTVATTNNIQFDTVTLELISDVLQKVRAVSVDQEGRFFANHLPPGSYRVRASLANQPIHETMIDLRYAGIVQVDLDLDTLDWSGMVIDAVVEDPAADAAAALHFGQLEGVEAVEVMWAPGGQDLIGSASDALDLTLPDTVSLEGWVPSGYDVPTGEAVELDDRTLAAGAAVSDGRPAYQLHGANAPPPDSASVVFHSVAGSPEIAAPDEPAAAAAAESAEIEDPGSRPKP